MVTEAFRLCLLPTRVEATSTRDPASVAEDASFNYFTLEIALVASGCRRRQHRGRQTSFGYVFCYISQLLSQVGGQHWGKKK